MEPPKKKFIVRRCRPRVGGAPVYGRGEGEGGQPEISPPGFCDSSEVDQSVVVESSPVTTDMGIQRDDNGWRPVSESDATPQILRFADTGTGRGHSGPMFPKDARNGLG